MRCPQSPYAPPNNKKSRRPGTWSSNVIFAAGREHIYDQGIFQSRGSVFDAAADRETVTGPNLECFSLRSDLQMSANHVNNLFVGVAVDRANPTLQHLVLGEKEFVVVRHHLACQTWLRFGLLRGL